MKCDINSKEYWNSRFLTGDWDNNQGREQTTFFYRIAINNLPHFIINEINKNQLSICDLGCAEGDGTNILSKFFLNSTVTGIDFSEEAINRAILQYPNNNFDCKDIKNVEDKYDIVFSSNTLEHFKKPFEMIKEIIKFCNKYFIMLLPFKEFDRIDEHFFTFDYNTFPLKINNFYLVHYKEIDCEHLKNTQWAGKEILVVYANNEYVNIENIYLDTLNDNIYENEKIIKHLQRKVEEVERKVQEKNEKISYLNNLIKEKELNISYLMSSINKATETINSMEATIYNLRLKENDLILKIKEIKSLKDVIAKKENENINYYNQLKSIYESHFWKVAIKYYKIRDNFWPINQLHKYIKNQRLRKGLKEQNIFLKVVISLKKYGIKYTLKKIYQKVFNSHQNEGNLSNCNMINWYEYKFLRYKLARNSVYKLEIGKVKYGFIPGLVSIVLPVYNGELMIAQAIESILKQTYKKFELIIIDDGSEDKTPEIIEQYANMDKRIIAIHQENRKIPRTLSRGFRLARGEYFTWTSADNILHPNCIEKLVSCLRADGKLGMVYANMRLIDEKGELITDHTWYPSYKGSPIVNLPNSTLELNIYPNNTIGAAFMYRGIVGQLLEDYSEYRHTLEDYDYWMRVNSLFKVSHVPFNEPIYDYRIHSKSLTSQDKQLGITENRYKLMVLDDFRRDFYLSPMIWIIEGDEDSALYDELCTIVKNANHMLINKNKLLSLDMPKLGVPVVYIKICSLYSEINEDISDLPPEVYRIVLLNSSNKNLLLQEDSKWDCCIIVGEIDSPALLNDYKGWFNISDVKNVFSFIDIKVKNKYLYKIEGQIEAKKIYKKKVSVIICTYKRSQSFVNALNSIINQSFPKNDYEIVVVNNDFENYELKDLIDEYKIKLNRETPDFIKYTVAPFKGLSFARNVGMYESEGEILIYIDDDAIGDYRLVEETYRCFEEHPEAGVIGGQIKLNIPNPKPDVLLDGMEALWSQFLIDGEVYMESNYQWEFPYGANYAVRKDALLRIGGFRTSYGRIGNNFAGGEEMVISFMMNTIGYKVGRNPKSKVIHDVETNRYTLEHVEKTIKASLLTNYQLQKDLYAPMESNIEYDIEQADKLKKEIEILQAKNVNDVYKLEILYKQYSLNTIEELINIKKEDIKNRIHLANY